MSADAAGAGGIRIVRRDIAWHPGLAPAVSRQ